MKLIAYKTALTLFLEIILPVVALFSGYRPWKRRSAMKRRLA